MLIGMGESKYLRYLFLVTSDNAVVNSMDTLRKYFAHFSVRHKPVYASIRFRRLRLYHGCPVMMMA